MALHLDSATEDQLLGIHGVGGSSSKAIIKFLKQHKTFTSLKQLKECAPQLDVEQFRMQHDIGTWTSEISEFRNPALSTNDTPDKPDSDTLANANTDTIQDVIAEETPEGATSVEDKLIESGESSYRHEMLELRKFVERQIEAVSNAFMTTLNNTATQLRVEMRTTKVVNAQNAKAPAGTTSKPGPGAPLKPAEREAPFRPTSTTIKGFKQESGGASNATTGAIGGGNKLNTAQFGGARKKTNKLPLSTKSSFVPAVKPAIVISEDVDPDDIDMIAPSDDSGEDGYVDQFGGEYPQWNNFDPQRQYRPARREPRQPQIPDARFTKLVDKFDGKVGQWENWFHKFEHTAQMCQWSDHTRLFTMTNALTGPALTAHRNLPKRDIADYSSLVRAMRTRFGKGDMATKGRTIVH